MSRVHGATACTPFELSTSIKLRPRSKISYSDARLAVGGKELQHHTVLNNIKPKPQKNVFYRRQVGIFRQGAADVQRVKSAQVLSSQDIATTQ